MSIPFQLSERMFRRYERDIHRIVQHYPLKVTIDSSGFSLETTKARLRDAMKSLLTYNWPTSIDVEHFKNIRPDIEVVEEDGMVVARRITPKDLVKGYSDLVEETGPLAGPMVIVDSPDMATLQALGLLISRKIIAGPFVLTKVNPAFLDEIVQRYSVGVVEPTPGTYQLF